MLRAGARHLLGSIDTVLRGLLQGLGFGSFAVSWAVISHLCLPSCSAGLSILVLLFFARGVAEQSSLEGSIVPSIAL